MWRLGCAGRGWVSELVIREAYICNGMLVYQGRDIVLIASYQSDF